MTVVNLRTAAVAASAAPVPYNQDAYARSSDGHELYLSGTSAYLGGTDGGIWSTRLVAVDLTQLATEWEESFWDANGPQLSRFDSLDVRGNYALALTPDQSAILLADATRYSPTGIAPADSFGIAVLDPRTRNVLGFIGSLRVAVGGLIPIKPSIFAPNGAVLALATRTFDPAVPRGAGTLFVLSGVPIGIRDSLAVLSTADSAAGGIRSMVLSADNRYLFFVTAAHRLCKYDLILRRTVATASVPTSGALAISPDGGRLFLTDDEGGIDVPPTGYMYVYAGDLAQLGAIDLRSASVGGIPPVANSIAVSADGDFVFVGAGTAPRGPTFGVQPGRLLVVDARAEKLVRVISVGGWAVNHIVLQ